MRAIVVRHYKTLLNASDRILGWGDAPRVDGWRADVNYVENRFREESIRFDAIYSSDLERARQTAMFYARRSRIHIVHDSIQLNEVNYGSLYGKSKKWVAKHIPEHKQDPDYVYPEGESFRQMQYRSVRFLVSLTESHPGQTLLFVVHAGVIRGLISHFLGLEYAENLKRKISHRYIGQLEFEGGECKRYDELGQKSGFVRSGVVNLPFRCSTSGVVQKSTESGLYL
ncbi:MAG: histidine phosphatase family protein [Pseudomonadota bacterium]|nr:histidine phosphatase family protein [Pseudomonadota bacterium]